MLIFGGAILLLAGAAMLFFPSAVYDITERWKSRFPDEPSDLYMLHIRIGGIACSLVGAIGLISAFLL